MCHNSDTVRGAKSRKANTAFSRYKANAKAKGLEFTITLDLVKQLFQQECVYCGDTEHMRTLDRQENNIGYTPDNVAACCIRCNLMKADMPLAAWLVMAPAVRAARESGLFGDWVGRNFNLPSGITK